VVLTLLSYVTVLPALLGALARLAPRAVPGKDVGMPGAGLLVRRAPWVFAAMSLGIGLLLFELPALRFNYDFSALDSADLPSFNLSRELKGAMGRSQTPMVVLAESQEDARSAASAIRARSSALGASSTIDRVLSLTDLVPEDQTAKAATVAEIAALLRRVDTGHLSEDERKRLDRARELASAGPFTRADLPEEVLRQFRDTRGHAVTDFVLVFPSVSMSDGRLAQRVAAEVRDLDLGGGRHISAAGETMVLADLIGSVMKDLPLLCGLALLQQIVVLSVLLGGLGRALLTLVPAIVSLPVIGALMPLLGLELNYLNVILVPTLIGMGEDGGAHLVTRVTGGDDLTHALRETGRGTLGSAATTAFGFGSLALAGHPGLRSFGEAAALGVGVNLLVCIAFLPALLAVIASGKRWLASTVAFLSDRPSRAERTIRAGRTDPAARPCPAASPCPPTSPRGT
jgi:uncharacterized protein